MITGRTMRRAHGNKDVPPESQLAVAVILRALIDLSEPKESMDALEFFRPGNSTMEFWCYNAGVEPVDILRVAARTLQEAA